MKFVALDVETHLIAPGCVAPRLVCVSVYSGDGDVALYDRIEGMAVARALLEDPDVTIIGHHIFFDLCVLAAEDETLLSLIFDEIDAGRVRDTKLRQQIIDNAEGKLKFVFNDETGEYNRVDYSLFTLVKRHLGRDVKHLKIGPDIWRLRYNELDGVPIPQWPPEASSYAIADAVDTFDIFMLQQAYCEPHGLPGGLVAEITQVQAAWALYLTGAWGVRTDGDAVAKLKAEVTEEYQAALATAQRHGFIRKGIKESRNTKAIKEAVQAWYAEHEKPMKWTTGGKSGQPQIGMDREQLTEIECSGCGFDFRGCSCGVDVDGVHRGLWAVAEVVRLGKLLSTYISALERGVKIPLNPTYNAIIETFRTSCSQGMKIQGVPMGCNLQNPPRKSGVRECFRPRPSTTFCFCDYDTLEMRTLAQTCIELFGYSHIADAIREGRDLHVAIAAELLGMTYEEAEEKYIAGDKIVAENRQVAKPANYGMAGGMAAETFIAYAKGQGTIVSRKTARQLHAAFRSTWREMNDYFAFISSLIGDGNRVQAITFPRSGLMRGDVTYTAAANGFFQHRAAMGAKDALYQVVRECYIVQDSPLFGCRSWLFAHDEIGIEIPYTGRRASDAALRLQQVMIDRMSWWCPDVPIGATACMTRRWYKGAKAVFDGGIMVPSRPEDKKWVRDDGDEERTAAA